MLLAGWVLQARGRWECGLDPVLTIQGWTLRPENSKRAPSPASPAGTPAWDLQGASVPTSHQWHQTAVSGKLEKKGLRENLRAGETLGKWRAHGQQGERGAGWA